MTDWTRFAIYVAPKPGPLFDFAAHWLGWDPAEGRERDHPDLAGMPRPAEDVTRTPRKYGFHGTVRAPFRPAEGTDLAAIDAGMRTLCGRLAPVKVPLRLGRLGSFLALIPDGPAPELEALAARVVRESDPWRAPLTQAEYARRKPETLDARGRALLDRWGYPHVMEAFRFHMTLTGPLAEAELDAVEAALAPELSARLPQPFPIEDLCLFGEGSDGRFRLLHRYALSG